MAPKISGIVPPRDKILRGATMQGTRWLARAGPVDASSGMANEIGTAVVQSFAIVRRPLRFGVSNEIGVCAVDATRCGV
jgi:hypothetical protein